MHRNLVGAVNSLPASAQQGFTLSGLGARVGVVEPEDSDSTFSTAFHLEFMRPGSHWHF